MNLLAIVCVAHVLPQNSQGATGKDSNTRSSRKDNRARIKPRQSRTSRPRTVSSNSNKNIPSLNRKSKKELFAAVSAYGQKLDKNASLLDKMLGTLKSPDHLSSVAKFLGKTSGELRKIIIEGAWQDEKANQNLEIGEIDSVEFAENILLRLIDSNIQDQIKERDNTSKGGRLRAKEYIAAIEKSSQDIGVKPDKLNAWTADLIERLYTEHKELLEEAITDHSFLPNSDLWISPFYDGTQKHSAKKIINSYAHAAGLTPREAKVELSNHQPRPKTLTKVATSLDVKREELLDYINKNNWDLSSQKKAAQKIKIDDKVSLASLIEDYARTSNESLSTILFEDNWQPEPGALRDLATLHDLSPSDVLEKLNDRTWIRDPSTKDDFIESGSKRSKIRPKRSIQKSIELLSEKPWSGSIPTKLAEFWIREQATMRAGLSDDLVSKILKTTVTTNQADTSPKQSSATRPQPSSAQAKTATPSAATPKAKPKTETALEQFQKMIGLESAKRAVEEILDTVETDKAKVNSGMAKRPRKYHFRFEGNPGTGKTTVARLMAKALKEIGYTKSDVFKEFTASDLKSEGRDAFRKAIKEAEGGIIFIDEIYDLDPDNDRDGKKIASELLTSLTNTNVTFIVAGYPKETEEFIASNDGFERRFTHVVPFDDYTNKELGDIMHLMVDAEDMKIDDTMVKQVVQKITRLRGKGFGNAGEVERSIARAILRQSKRVKNDDLLGDRASLESFTRSDFGLIPPGHNLKALDQFDELVGLEPVKENVRNFVDVLSVTAMRGDQNLTTKSPILHALYTGNPGTGKTTVAEIYGKALYEMGYLSSGEVIRVSRDELVSEIFGETAKNVKKIIARAKGKVLLIDEAYSLYKDANDSYGKEAIDTLVNNMKGNGGDDFAVVLAGYRKRTLKLFDVNDGMESRFPKSNHFDFPDYSQNELKKILKLVAKKEKYDFDDDAVDAFMKKLALQRKGRFFGNARAVNTIFDESQKRQSKRLVAQRNNTGQTPSESDLKRIVRLDVLGEEDPVDSAANALEGLIGLKQVRSKIKEFQATINQARKRKIDPFKLLPPYFLYSGNPGTGKTTVAKRFGKVFKDLGYLESDEVIRLDGQDLLAGYLGQTGNKTKELFESAIGKTLFIDEAYVLADAGDRYKKDAVDRLVSLLTEYEGQLVVVLAGYQEPLQDLLRMNDGLPRRFSQNIIFEDFTVNECLEIFDIPIKEVKSTLSKRAAERLKSMVHLLKTNEKFGNAGDMINLAKDAIRQQMLRAEDEGHHETEIKLVDLQKAFDEHIVEKDLDEDELERLNKGEDLSSNSEKSKRSGQSSVTFKADASGIALVDTTLSHGKNNVDLKMVFDTGAGHVAISTKTARELGIKDDAGRKVPMATANGNAISRLVTIKKVSVGGLTARNVEITISDNDYGEFGGLLGNTFLDRFSYEQNRGKITIRRPKRGDKVKDIANDNSSQEAPITKAREKIRQKEKKKNKANKKTEEHDDHDHRNDPLIENDQEVATAIQNVLDSSDLSVDEMVDMFKEDRFSDELRKAVEKQLAPLKLSDKEIERRVNDVLQNIKGRIKNLEEIKELLKDRKTKIIFICGVCGRVGCDVMPLPHVVPDDD